MKRYKSIGKLLAVSFFTAVIASACTEDAMDKVNKNPNNPQDAPAKFLITDLGVSTAFSQYQECKNCDQQVPGRSIGKRECSN